MMGRKEQNLEGLDSHNGWIYSSEKKKGTVLPYLLPSVGSGADPGVQAVSLQVAFKPSTRQ